MKEIWIYCEKCKMFGHGALQPHEVKGKTAVCTNCGDKKDLRKPHIEAKVKKQGGPERRV